MALVREKKKLHGIEVENSSRGWQVLRKYNRDFFEVLATCPNDAAAAEIAASLRDSSIYKAEITRLTHAIQSALTALDGKPVSQMTEAEKAARMMNIAFAAGQSHRAAQIAELLK